MSDFITVSSNIGKAKEVFEKLGGTPEILRSFVAAAAFEAVGKAKRDAPIDEGALVDGITAEYRPDLGEVYAIISNTFYAPYVEFGTGENVDVPKEIEDFALQFKGTKKIIGQSAQPYLYPAAVEAQTQVIDFILKYIKKQQQ